MNRFNSFGDMMDGNANPSAITLASELMVQKLYKINGDGPYVYQGRHEGKHVFIDSLSGAMREVTTIEMEKLISGASIVPVFDRPKADLTVPEYESLDLFTVNTFITPTADLWDRCGIIGTFSRTELLELDDLCRQLEIEDIPTPGDNKYMQLLADRRWPLFKRYVQNFSPDTELPENFG